MVRSLWRSLASFGLNLLAASLLWMASIGPDSGWAYLWSPVCLPVLMLWTFSHVVQLAVLGGFLACVLVVSLMCRSAKAMWVVAALIFVACFVQGWMSASLIAGIDAIGHS
jgi:hypothetical protein